MKTPSCLRQPRPHFCSCPLRPRRKPRRNKTKGSEEARIRPSALACPSPASPRRDGIGARVPVRHPRAQTLASATRVSDAASASPPTSSRASLSLSFPARMRMTESTCLWYVSEDAARHAAPGRGEVPKTDRLRLVLTRRLGEHAELMARHCRRPLRVLPGRQTSRAKAKML